MAWVCSCVLLLQRLAVNEEKKTYFIDVKASKSAQMTPRRPGLLAFAGHVWLVGGRSSEKVDMSQERRDKCHSKHTWNPPSVFSTTSPKKVLHCFKNICKYPYGLLHSFKILIFSYIVCCSYVGKEYIASGGCTINSTISTKSKRAYNSARTKEKQLYDSIHSHRNFLC